MVKMTAHSVDKMSSLPDKTFGIYVVLAFALGLVAAGVAHFIDPLYALFGLAGIIFFYMLIFYTEVAMILFLLVQNQLSQYNYMGNGTPFHPNGLLGVSIIGGAFWFFISHPIDRSRLRDTGALFGFLALCLLQLVITLISGHNSGYLLDQINVTLRLLAALSIYLILLYKLTSITKVKWVVAIVVAAQILPTLNGLLRAAGTSGFSLFEYAETARLGNSGVGVYLALILTICLVFYLNANKNPGRLIWGVLTIFYALGLFFSYGRAGWISFTVGLAVIGLLRHRRLLLMLPVLLILVIGNIPAITERFADLSTFTERVVVWKAALAIFVNNPIFGTGYGTGRYLVGDLLRQYSYQIHNDYLSVLLETGVVGLTLFLIWHGQWLISLFKTYQTARLGYDKTLELVVFAVFFISLISRSTDNVLIDTYKMYPLCALMAAAFALPRIRAGQEPDANKQDVERVS
jgi:O-antigen ligase